MKIKLMLSFLLAITATFIACAQHTTTTSTYNRSSSYSSSINAEQNLQIDAIITNQLEAPDVDKDHSKIWFFSNKKERFEVKLYSNEINISFKSNIENSKVELMLQEMIEQINQVIDSENED